jgi:rifampicin phosphotransferase
LSENESVTIQGCLLPSSCSIIPDFMNRMSALTGRDTMETLKLLEAASPESRGILNKQDITLAKLYNGIKRNQKALELLRCEETMAPWALDCLLHLPGELGEVFRQVAIEYGWRLAGGYDLTVPAMIETPNFFLKTILQGVEEEVDFAEESEERVEKLSAEWRNALPEDKREEFDLILDMGRRFFRIRDERGLCTDLSGVGLCRRGIIEAGRRLRDAGVINQPDHLTTATKAEALSLLTGDLRSLSLDKTGPVDVPTSKVLESRFLYIKNADPNSVPRALGTPPPPPPPDMPLPPGIGRTMENMNTGLTKGIWDETPGSEEDVKDNPDKVVGVSAATGVVTAPVVLVLQDSDLQYVKKGDIIVTYSSSASFNMVLGLCSGIVTNYGGMLSHAAIVAREYGIPAIVGTQVATEKFKSGDVVTIDSSTSSVTRVVTK